MVYSLSVFTCSKSTLETPEVCEICSAISNVNFEQVNAEWGEIALQKKTMVSDFIMPKSHLKRMNG